MERAYVVQLLDKYHVKVQIPILNKIAEASGSTPIDELPIAVINTMPGCSVELSEGDAVLVDFETEDYSKPIVVGKLFCSEFEFDGNTFGANNLKIINSASLPEDTSIGETTPQALASLKDLNVELHFNPSVDSSPDSLVSLEWVEAPEEVVAPSLAERLRVFRLIGSTNRNALIVQQSNISDLSEELGAHKKDFEEYKEDIQGSENSAAQVVWNYENKSVTKSTPYTFAGLAQSIALLAPAVKKDSIVVATNSGKDVTLDATDHRHEVTQIGNIFFHPSDSEEGISSADAQSLYGNPRDGSILFVYNPTK